MHVSERCFCHPCQSQKEPEIVVIMRPSRKMRRSAHQTRSSKYWDSTAPKEVLEGSGLEQRDDARSSAVGRLVPSPEVCSTTKPRAFGASEEGREPGGLEGFGIEVVCVMRRAGSESQGLGSVPPVYGMARAGLGWAQWLLLMSLILKVGRACR